jgi:hypothetical protein
MPYIGKAPVSSGFHKLDALTASATDTYSLTLGGASYFPETANQLLCSLNGIIQAPQDSFTVSGSNLIFDSALTASDSIDFVVALGDVLGVGSVTDGAITTAKIGNNAVTDAKLANTLDLSAKALTMPAGSVLQVQSSVSTAASTITSTSYADIPSMTATITPASTSSKILVQVSFGLLSGDNVGTGCLMKLFRGSTEIGQGVGADTHNVFMQNYNNATNVFEQANHMFVDSPSSTSAITYKMQWALTGTGETWYMNRRGSDNYARTSSTFLLTEIAG